MASRKSPRKSAAPPVAPELKVATSSEHPPGSDFPIVGIGASAGGLAAFEGFFSGMPVDADPGMAFVLVQHLAPDYKSMLADLVRCFTRMPVFQIEDGMQVQVNRVYIIPPRYDLALLNGTLHLLEPGEPRAQRLPVDSFFRSLALDQRERAIGIVLSGTGSDGALGVRAIKAAGGLVMAQSPELAEYDGMPNSAIASGQVDYSLPVAAMPAQLMACVAHGLVPRQAIAQTPLSEGVLKNIFVLLRARTGHDFSQYKPSTIHRRIERRMAVHGIDAIDTYFKYMQQTPLELDALFRDLLIGVTRFFRDPAAFQVLEEQVIPRIFAGKPAAAEVRVWSAGCSTGEEAYSLAILLYEHMEAKKQGYSLQVFATDIDHQAIATARAGLYPLSIAADLSPARLARFFTLEPDGSAYRISKVIRDLLIFSEQDVIKDPPFSRLDLISCRNLMIYFGSLLQKRLIPLFHYALKPDGLLFLGTSEGIGEFDELFSVLDRKAKLYLRKASCSGAQRVALSQLISPLTERAAVRQARVGKPGLHTRRPLRELTEQAVLRQIAPAAALVNEQGDILYVHGHTGNYLEPAPGEAGVNNILKMARDGLRHALGNALRQVVLSQATVHCPALGIKINGHFRAVNLTLSVVRSDSGAMPEAPFYLVLLEDAPAAAGEHAHPAGLDAPLEASAEALVAELRQELRSKDEYLQSTHEELESSSEELRSANEEMQSVNEELQSTNEELETSKEELQSVNEELSTVNAELQAKVADLSQANNDMNNLLAGTGIATVFVDHQLRILRYTPTASAIINLIPGDVGRPVGHVVVNLVSYSRLTADIKAVLDTLLAREIDVESTDGCWYTLRIQPYRTLDNVIEGAVITFVDITEMVRVRESLRRLTVVVSDASDAITVQDLDGRLLAWNPGAVRLYGWSEAEALGMNVRERIPQALRAGALARLVQFGQADILQPYRTQRLNRDGELVDVAIISTALINESGQMYAVATTERAIGGERS